MHALAPNEFSQASLTEAERALGEEKLKNADLQEQVEDTRFVSSLVQFAVATLNNHTCASGSHICMQH